ncbi:MAG: hypothetical protein RL226_1897 [Bacteroidota bacterium]
MPSRQMDDVKVNVGSELKRRIRPSVEDKVKFHLSVLRSEASEDFKGKPTDAL